MGNKMQNKIEERNAEITDTFLGIEDHGIMSFNIQTMSDGCGQGFGGYGLDQHNKITKKRDGWGGGVMMLRGILETIGVSKWEDLKGKFCRVRAIPFGRIVAVGHIINDKWFVFDEFIKSDKEAQAVRSKL